MSSKVSSASSASTGANIAGGKTTPTAAASPAAGSTGSDGVSAAAGARGSSAGSATHFASAMAEAAHSGDQAAAAYIRDGGSQADADGAADGGNGADTGTGEASRGTTAADTTGDAGPAVKAGAPDISADAAPVLSQNAANPKTSASGTGKAGGSRAGARTGGDERTGGAASASPVPTDPVALAMLLAASGMQLGGDAGASSASNGSSGAPATAPAGAAAKIIAGVAGADAAPAAGSAADTAAAVGGAGNSGSVAVAANSSAAATSAQQAHAAAPPALEAASSSAAAGGGLPGASAPLQDKNVNPESQTAQPSIVTDAAGLPELVRSFAGGATQAPAAEATISVPLASGGWPQAVAAQVHWFVNNDVQSATLRLSPEHLGPVEVRIDVRESQVNVNFSAAHPETRAALEQTVPRLREIFASGGLSLGQANVQQDPRTGSQSSANPLRAALAHAQTVDPVAVAAGQGLGLVDEYA